MTHSQRKGDRKSPIRLTAQKGSTAKAWWDKTERGTGHNPTDRNVKRSIRSTDKTALSTFSNRNLNTWRLLSLRKWLFPLLRKSCISRGSITDFYWLFDIRHYRPLGKIQGYYPPSSRSCWLSSCGASSPFRSTVRWWTPVSLVLWGYLLQNSETRYSIWCFLSQRTGC